MQQRPTTSSQARPRPAPRTQSSAQQEEEPAETSSTAKSSTTTSAPRDYTSKYRSGSTASSTRSSSTSGKGQPLGTLQPNETAHIMPIVLLGFGLVGAIAGVITNFWQMVTTFVAFWSMFNPKTKPTDFQRQPVILCICVLIAFSFQLALLFLVFRLDRVWKKNKAQGESSGKAAAGAVVEVVNHADLVLFWSLIGFVVDTVGDYTFISIYTTNADPATAIFLIFIYAIALYACSTVGFVLALECIWASFAGVARHLAGS